MVTTGERLGTLEPPAARHRNLSEDDKGRLTGEKGEAEEQLKSLDRAIAAAEGEEVGVDGHQPDRRLRRHVGRGEPAAEPARAAGAIADARGRSAQRMAVGTARPRQPHGAHRPGQNALKDEESVRAIRTGARDLEGHQGLDVQYQLATSPGTTLHGNVSEIHQSAEVRGEEGNTVLIKVDIDKTTSATRGPAPSVTGKVYCGRRSIGYVWFHDVFEFVQSRILFRYF